MIVLFTDYGASDIYVGQVKAAILEQAPGVQIVDLLHQAPAFNPKTGAHLLAALAPRFPMGSTFFAVIDPGVGGRRTAVAMRADGRWYVGPDNGLLSVIAARAAKCELWRITWQPPGLSPSFHGRDLFAPIAAGLAQGDLQSDRMESISALEIQFGDADLPEIIYVDHYGNALTGLRAATVAHDRRLAVAGQALPFARVFCEAPEGEAFWYENSIGLVEIAANCGSAAERLELRVGQAVGIV